jgi:hypothetical protein
MGVKASLIRSSIPFSCENAVRGSRVKTRVRRLYKNLFFFIKEVLRKEFPIAFKLKSFLVHTRYKNDPN